MKMNVKGCVTKKLIIKKCFFNYCSPMKLGKKNARIKYPSIFYKEKYFKHQPVP